MGLKIAAFGGYSVLYLPEGTIHKRRPHRGGEGGWPKSRHTDIVREVFVQVNPKFGQGGEGSKIPKILRTSFMHGPKAVRISARHDQYRDTVTLQLTSPKDRREAEGKRFVTMAMKNLVVGVPINGESGKWGYITGQWVQYLARCRQRVRVDPEGNEAKSAARYEREGGKATSEFHLIFLRTNLN